MKSRVKNKIYELKSVLFSLEYYFAQVNVCMQLHSLMIIFLTDCIPPFLLPSTSVAYAVGEQAWETLPRVSIVDRKFILKSTFSLIYIKVLYFTCIIILH